LESQSIALTEKLRDVSVQVSVLEYGLKHNERVAEIQRNAGLARQNATALDVSNVSAGVSEWL